MAIFSLTRKADYGLLMLSELARRGRGGLVSIKKLSDDKGLPKAFLAQIGQNLVKAGIIGSKEGRNGGYYLNYDPKEVEVKEALEAIEGEIGPVWCTTERGSCPIEERCEQKNFMNKLSMSMTELLSKYTLADLVAK